MRTIHKFQLDVSKESQVIQVQSVAVPRSVGKDPGGAICLWIEVDTAYPKRPMTVYMPGTGHEVSLYGTFVGTVIDGAHVWHVYLDQSVQLGVVA